MTKLQEASFSLDAVKDQIANAIEARRSQWSSTGPEGI